jgi:hypothetical protein
MAIYPLRAVSAYLMSSLVAETFRALKREREFVFTNPRTGRKRNARIKIRIL